MNPISEMKILYNRVKKNHMNAVVLIENEGEYITFREDAEMLSKNLSLEIQGESVRMGKERISDILQLSIPIKVVEYGKDNRGGYRRGAGKKKVLKEGTRYVGFYCPPDLLAALGSKDRSKQIIDILYRELLPDTQP